MVPTSPQDVQPTLTLRRQLLLYVALFALILILGAVAYVQTILPLLIAGAIVAIGFFQVLSFRALFLLLLLLFFLISPAIPVSEKHFSKPISGGGFFLQDAVLLLLFGRALFDYFNAPRALQPFRSTLLEQIFALYVAVNLASAVYGALNGNTPTYLLGDVRDFFYFLLFWVYLHYFKSEADLDFAFTALIVVGFIFAAISLADDFLIRNFVRYNSGISFLLVACTLALLSKIFTERLSIKAPSTFIMLLVMLTGLFITFTRGLYLGFVAGFFMMLLALGIRRSFKLVLILGALVLGVLGVMLVLGISFDRVITQATYRGSSALGDLDISSAERILEVLAVLDELPNHWLFGKGAGATIAVYRFGDANVKEGIVDWWFIHNNYAQVLHKSGVIGLLCLLALWLSALTIAFRLFQRATSPVARQVLLSAVGVLTAYMVTSLTSPVMTYLNTNFVSALLFASIVFFNRLERAPLRAHIRD
jgi:hypothetical protein